MLWKMFPIEIIARSSSHEGLLLFSVLAVIWSWFHFTILLMSHWSEHLDVKCVWSIWRTLMSHSWMSSAKNVNVLAPASKIFFFFHRSGREVLREPRRYCSSTTCAPLKKKSWHAGVIIQLVDAENYSNINASPGSNHKHCDEAKTKVPAGFETVWNSHADDLGEATWESGLLCVIIEANPRWWIVASVKLRHLLFLL